MAIPQFSMRELIEAGVHFGHKTKRWNPRMAPYIYGVRNNIHIIDLQKTVPMLHRALSAVRSTVAQNGRILFVGTKRQASDVIAEAASRSGQYYINQRWLGGMLTNWNTIQESIKRLRKIEENLADPNSGFTKKERLSQQRQQEKLERSLGGIKEMGGLPDLLFIVDTNREQLAVAEANKLGIPVIAIVDTNCDAEGIDYPIPGNDDSTRAIKLYCKLISDAALDGIQQSLSQPEKPAKEEVAEQVPTEKAEAAQSAAVDESVKKTTKKQAYAEAAKKAAKQAPKGKAASPAEQKGKKPEVESTESAEAAVEEQEASAEEKKAANAS